MTYKRTLKYCWLKLRRLQGDPKKLAWGMALGVFIGVTPTLPFHTGFQLTSQLIGFVSTRSIFCP